MIDETHLRVLLEPDLVLVVADQNEGWVETGDQLPDDPVQQILFENVETGVIGQNED